MIITIASKWLSAHLDDPDLIIIDARGTMPYRLAHIKNARPLNVERVISIADNGANVVIDMPTAEKIFGDLGIDDSKKVVVYGEYMDPSAARVVWTLLYHGHPNSMLLDIGFNVWRASGLSFTREVPNKIRPAQFKSNPNPSMRADAELIKSKQNNPNVVIVDARTTQEHIQARIPGSILHNWEVGLGDNGAMFKSKGELRNDFESNGITIDKEIICYCHSGSRSAHKYLQLKNAGFDKVRMYDGSIIDWAPRGNPIR
jgi:thiosulfate/3-mercaptopyruvate sulfurtransferase